MQNKTATQIQAEIDLMRAMYARRMHENQPRRDRMIGWCLLAIATVIPALVAAVILL